MRAYSTHWRYLWVQDMSEQWGLEARRCVYRGVGGNGSWDRSYLVLVQFTVLVLLLTLGTEGDDDKAHKDVHHEECDDDNVDNEEH